MSVDEMPDRRFYGTRVLAEITGYHQKTLQDLAAREYAKPEAERILILYKESNRYFIELGSLKEYAMLTGYELKNSD